MSQLQEHYDKIYRYCFFKIRDARLAEDLTQETFLRFFSRNNYVNRGKPLAYMYTVAKNLCADSFRESASVKKNTEPLTDEAPAPGTGLYSREDSLALRQALAELPDDSREVFLLRYANELSMAEISAVTGLSRFSLRRKINASLKFLKERMV